MTDQKTERKTDTEKERFQELMEFYSSAISPVLLAQWCA